MKSRHLEESPAVKSRHHKPSPAASRHHKPSPALKSRPVKESPAASRHHKPSPAASRHLKQSPAAKSRHVKRKPCCEQGPEKVKKKVRPPTRLDVWLDAYKAGKELEPVEEDNVAVRQGKKIRLRRKA